MLVYACERACLGGSPREAPRYSPHSPTCGHLATVEIASISISGIACPGFGRIPVGGWGVLCRTDVGC